MNWYKKYWRHDLPWRQHFDMSVKDVTYGVWLAEIILQQTQVERWVTYYDKLLNKYPTIESLAWETYEGFYIYYKWLWYYSRARNMLKTAKIISEEFGGIFPNDQKKLESLPWIGEYTAQAIRGFGYDEKVLSFDTNLNKIFSRYFYGTKEKKLSLKIQKEIEKDFQKTSYSWREMNWALMDFWSLVSLNSVDKIDWKTYPLKDSQFYRTQWKLENNIKTKNDAFPIKKSKVVVILHKDHKEYYSESENYKPFILKPSWVSDIRKYVKEYFLKKYELDLSVRPVHKKDYINSKPHVFVYAQIQVWSNVFNIFSKKDLESKSKMI